ncbi:MAG: UDP-N-acetylmuramate--L-alanine ligase [Bacteroidia bacterium]|nr:UDP-N-acetylmuramate--L-alanine ligase [Bacteroidia bacterium]
MTLDKINNVYFIGIGGIGMSALARYFKAVGKNIAGYDRTATELTSALRNEGMNIHYEENIEFIPSEMKNGGKDQTLVVYTPAIPKDHKELTYFISQGYILKKRSEVLGIIIKNKKGIAVAGTHGKTTVSSMIAHLLNNSPIGCNAFLGGIAKNYNSNLLLSEKSKFVVAEADEFDRSFLHLNPQIAVITAVDADHLDVYGNTDEMKKAFTEFTGCIQNNGSLVIKKGIGLKLNKEQFYHVYKYALNSEADFYARNIRVENNLYVFDMVTPLGSPIRNITLGVPGLVNVENAVAALAVGFLSGVSEQELKNAMKTFSGNKRRFDVQIHNDRIVYIDDYAHHPEELKAFINSVKELYPGKKLTGIFQPHLFSRTRDFAGEFAKGLDLLDELILLDIYPAREEPIKGVTSEIIFTKVNLKNKILCNKCDLLKTLETKKPEVLLTMGAGDIDRFAEPIKKLFDKN